LIGFTPHLHHMPSEYLYTRIDELAEPVAALRARLANRPIPARRGLCGFDGFIDSFIRVESPDNLAEFGRRTLAAAGISASYPVRHGEDKFGGNGPLLACALHSLFGGACEITYVGGLGYPEPLPIFQRAFAGKINRIYTLADPAHSDCVEFNDGKIMLSDLSNCAQISWERLLEQVGPDAVDALLRQGDFIAAVNWGKLVQAGPLWENLAKRLRALAIPPKQVVFFMDLAEFEQRPTADRLDLVARLQTITAQCRTYLSLNLKEAWQLSELWGPGFHGQRSPDRILELTRSLRHDLKVDCLIVHPNDGAACATADRNIYIPGPHCQKPLISTGAGDHFGAGALAAILRGEDELGLLLMANSTSGHFVRSGQSPSFTQLDQFLDGWVAGKLPERL